MCILYGRGLRRTYGETRVPRVGVRAYHHHRNAVDNLSSLTLCSTHTLFVGDGDTGTNWIHGGMRHGGGTSKQSK